MKNIPAKIKKWGNVFWGDFKKLTSIKIGGQALVFSPFDLESLKAALRFFSALGISYRILGYGSNLLVDDKGINEVVIKLAAKSFCYLKREGDMILAGSGLGLKQLLDFCCRQNLAGLEFLAGVPASVGGALRNNAGAFGRSILDFAVSVVLARQGRVIEQKKENFFYSYRNFKMRKGDVIVGAKFKLKPSKKTRVLEKIKANLSLRRQNQDLRFPSSGCVWLNPSDSLPAALLLDGWGAKGLRKGDIAISEKHANFIINLGQASFKDALSLVKYIEKGIKRDFGLSLKREVEVWSREIKR